MYYVVYIMETSGIGDTLLTSSIQYILNVTLTLPAIIYLDKWGRRPSLLLGSFAMMVLLFIVGALQAVYGHPFHADTGPLAAITWILDDNSHVSRAVVACSYLFVCSFAVTWVYSPLPPHHHYLQSNHTRAPPHGPTPPRSSPPRSAPKPSP